MMTIYVSVSTKDGVVVADRVMVNVLPGGTVVQTAKMVRKSIADERKIRPSQMCFVAYTSPTGAERLAASA
jgi:hypothetical protein